jgi:hypothetical protein
MGRKIPIFQHVPHEILGTFDPLLKHFENVEKIFQWDGDFPFQKIA